MKLASFQPEDGSPNRRPVDVRPVIERTCVTDGWPEPRGACLSAAKVRADADSCGLTKQEGPSVGAAIERDLGLAQEPDWVKHPSNTPPSDVRADDPPP